MEFRHPGSIAFYATSENTTAGTVVTPIARMWIDGVNGNVGIGTTNPNDIFSIGNSGAAPAGSSKTGHNFTSTYLATDDYALANYGLVKTLVANATSSLVAGSLWNGTLNGNIYNGAAGAGNVGIGTNAPSAKLYVNDKFVTSGVVSRINSDNITSGQMLSLTHSSSTFSGVGLFMNFQSGTGVSTANYLDLRNNNVSRFSINYRGGITSSYASDTDNTNLHNFTLTNGNASAGSYTTLNVTATNNTVASNGTGGTDELLDNNIEGFMFNSGSNTNISGLYIQLKRDDHSPANVGAYLRARLYTDNGGQPGTYITYSGSVPVSKLTTTYANTFFAFDATLVTNTNYWMTLEKVTFNAADNVYVNTTTTGGSGWAGGDGTTWSVAPTSKPIFALYPRSPRALFGNSTSNIGVYGNSNFNYGVRGTSVTASAIYGNSSYGYGGEFAGAGIYNAMNILSGTAIYNATTIQRTGQRYFDLGYNTGFSGDAFNVNLGANVYTVYYLYDNGTTFTDYTNTARQANGAAYPVLATTNDHFYFGRSASTSSYRNIYLNLANTPNLSGVIWEYGSGVDVNGDCTWTSFTPTNDETNGLLRSGMITPGSFALTQCKVNGINQYWMRVAASSITTGVNAYSSGFGFFSGYFDRFYSSDIERFRVSNSGSVLSSDPIYPGTIDPEDGVQAGRYLYDLGGAPFAALGFNTGLYVANNVGIGTTNPNDALSVGNSGAAPAGSARTGHNYTSTYLSTDDYALANYGLVKTLVANATSSLVAGSLWNGTLNGNIYNGAAGAGNVGIGTNNPLAKLQISVGTVAGTAPNLLRLTNTGTTDGSGTSIYMGYNNNLADPYGIRLVQKGYPSSYRSGTFDIQRHNITAGDTDADWLSSLFINQSGNVGIGTTNPGALLQIASRFKFNSDGTMNWGTNADFGALSWDTGKAIIVGMSGKDLSLGSNGSWDQLYIKSGGNVGIGTTTPEAKLSVIGNMVIRNSNGLKMYDSSGYGGASISSSYRFLNGEMFIAPAGSTISTLFSPNNGVSVGIDASPPANGLIIGGNVGVGTNVPNDTLSIGNAGAAPAGSAKTGHNFTSTYLSTDDYALANYGLVKTLVANATSSLTAAIGLWSGTDNGNIWNGDAGAGNVGIGTNTPGFKLEVNGSFKATASSSSIILDSNGDIQIGI